MRPEVVGIPCGCVPNGQELTLRLRQLLAELGDVSLVRADLRPNLLGLFSEPLYEICQTPGFWALLIQDLPPLQGIVDLVDDRGDLAPLFNQGHCALQGAHILDVVVVLVSEPSDLVVNFPNLARHVHNFLLMRKEATIRIELGSELLLLRNVLCTSLLQLGDLLGKLVIFEPERDGLPPKILIGRCVLVQSLALDERLLHLGNEVLNAHPPPSGHLLNQLLRDRQGLLIL
mmetsp:Transcript_9351/g.22296  ORF Transcript_9351/g.22296 Transcript_9351/m.22296 type:complete len:231 (+) Transcript_9351:678-1370(+)